MGNFFSFPGFVSQYAVYGIGIKRKKRKLTRRQQNNRSVDTLTMYYWENKEFSFYCVKKKGEG